MAWPPLLSWILSSSSSSSSSEYESDDNNDIEDLGGINDVPDNNPKSQNDNIDDHENDDVSYQPQEEDQNSNSTSDYTFTVSEPSAKRRRIDRTYKPALTSDAPEENKKRRRKRVWSKEDELELLRSLLDDYYSRGQIRTTVKDTASFYEEVKPKLKLECNRAQMVEKLRRLKKKYHNVVNKMKDMNSTGKEFRFKNPHDKVVFELSDKIWNVVDSHEDYAPNSKYVSICNNVKVKKEEDNVGSSSVADHERPQMRHTWSHSRLTTTFDENTKAHDVLNDNGTTSSLNNNNKNKNNNNNVDDNMKNDIPGLIIEGLAMNPLPLSLSKFGSGVEVADEKWRKQQILELETYSKRLDLVQHQVKAALDELRSKGDE
ncbi:hypothetical protein PRUPE_6G338700 [Prunus persica]|uniref:Glabrous enhancer-binding protein-like DBD domain-containing protein n=1 Tax=Prunus persica TaxID=3760 RepID=A0A251P170_PRUPE|nr:probable transcription factor At5g28040 [Prunus persica]ONI04770.1 hypothetical protein PRUPE_6G338700 [Prunus persica]